VVVAPAGPVSLLFQVVVVVLLGGVLVDQVRARGAAAITLDWFIGACLVAGLVVHGRAGPLSWAQAMGRGAGEAGGVLVHFPFYFGVVGVAVDSGLVAGIAATAAEVSRALPLPVATATALQTFVSAAIINLVVPSGGGQWAVQGPLIVETARVLGVERAPLIMAFAWGDQLTNLLQPFWALPILSITGLKARDLLPHTVVLMGVGAVVIVVGILALA
jgi:short-chain fatty acids transporter